MAAGDKLADFLKDGKVGNEDHVDKKTGRRQTVIEVLGGHAEDVVDGHANIFQTMAKSADVTKA